MGSADGKPFLWCAKCGSYADARRGYSGKYKCTGVPTPQSRRAYCREHYRKRIFEQGIAPWRGGQELIHALIPLYAGCQVFEEVMEKKG